MAIRITAGELHEEDVINFGGERAHVDAIRRDGALVVVLLPELEGFFTFDAAHPLTLLARPAAHDVERSVRRRQWTREKWSDGVRNDCGNRAAAA